MSKFKKEGRIWKKVDGTPISNEDIMELQELTYKSALEHEKLSSNPKFHRTELEENIKFIFSQEFNSEIVQLDNSIYSEVSKISACEGVDLKIKQCKVAITTYEIAKEFCYTKGKGGQLYFDDMWENCHNSKCECFSFIQRTRDLLTKLETPKKTNRKLRISNDDQI